MTKRAPIIVVGIIVLVLLAAPLAIGMMTENALTQQVGIYTQNPALVTNVESYERSWFTSRAELGIRLSDSYLEQLDTLGQGSISQMLGGSSLPVIVEIFHGPVLLNDGFAIGSAGVKAYVDPESQLGILAAQFLGIPYLFEYRGRGGFGGGFQFEGEIPPFENALGETSYAFSGFDFSGVMQAGDTQLTALLESASYQSPLESVLVEGVVVDVDYDYRQGMLPLSNMALNIRRVTTSNPLLGAQPLIALEDAGFGGTMIENDAGTYIDVQAFYRLGKFDAAGLFSIGDFDLSIDLNHLEAEAAAVLYELYREQISLPPFEQDLSVLEAPLARLLAGEPTLTINPLHFAMAGGEFNATANVSLDNDALPTGGMRDFQDLMVLQQGLVMDLDMTASKRLVEYLGGMLMEQQLAFVTGPDGQPMPLDQIQAMASAQLNLMLTGLAAQGLLVDEGDSYSMAFQLNNGTATANGQPIPLGAF